MKALVNTGVETLTYMDQADPIAKAGEELVRIQYSGICGSDMHAFWAMMRAGLHRLFWDMKPRGRLLAGRAMARWSPSIR